MIASDRQWRTYTFNIVVAEANDPVRVALEVAVLWIHHHPAKANRIE